MSLPFSLGASSQRAFIPETMTIEEFIAHMKQVSSSVYLPDESGGVVATVRYDYGYPMTPWIYDYFGECKTREVNKQGLEVCATWVHEPYIRRFASLYGLAFWLAFVGLEYS